MNRQVFKHTDRDHDSVRLNKPHVGDPQGTVGFVTTSTGGAWVDREGAVGLISALTDLVEAHDTEEARKAEAAKEAAKLKAGDVVQLGSYSTSTRVVISDETEAGYVDLVILSDEFPHLVGQISRRLHASRYRRVEK